MTTMDPIFENIRAWKESGDQDSTKRLLQIALEHKNVSARVAAARALGELRGMEPVIILGRMLNSDKAVARALAAEALGEMADPKAFDAVCAALNDPDAATRGSAARALGRFGDARALSALITRMAQDEWDVRQEAAASVAALGSERALDPLLEWSRGLLQAEVEDWTAEDKIHQIKSVFGTLLPKLGPEVLERLSPHTSQTVDIRQMGDAQGGGVGRWITRSLPDPVGVAVSAELERRAELALGPDDDEPEFNAEIQIDISAAPAPAPAAASDAGGGIEGLNLDDPLAGLDLGGPPSPAKAPAPPPPAPQEEETAEEPAAASSDADTIDEETPAGSAQAVQPEPARNGAAPADDESGPITMPELTGPAADFLMFLNERGIDDVALIGGAIRDAIRGRQPRDLDVTVRVRVSPEARRNSGDPLLWNTQFAIQVLPPLRKLAEALGCSYEDLLEGRAEFGAGERRLPVHYVGPYLLEEETTTSGRRSVGQVVKRRVSRLGLVADPASFRVIGLVSTSTIDRICVDREGEAVGDCEEGVQHLLDSYLHVDGLAERPGVIDLFRILTLRHELGARFSDDSISAISAISRAIEADLDLARAEHHPHDVERLLAAAEIESLVEDLLNLEQLELIRRFLPEETRARIDEILAAREAAREERLKDSREANDRAQATLATRQSAFETSNQAFAECAGGIQEARTRQGELEARRREANERLAEAEARAREIEARLEQAASKFIESSAGGRADVATIREHREALAAKEKIDHELVDLHKEIDTLQDEAQRGRESMRELQTKMATLSEGVETALTAFEAAQAEAADAEAALRALEAELQDTPERRREKLKSAPAVAERV